MSTTERHNYSASSKAIENANYMEMPEETNVFAWSPEPPGTPNARMTQVHLHFKTSLATFFVRFKGPGTLDRLIEALVEHRENVWGKPAPASSVIPSKVP